MGKIFYADNSTFSSEKLVTRVLSEHYGIKNAIIARAEHGKPYLQNVEIPLFFSISHTKEKTFIAFSEKDLGLDAESLSREVRHQPICHKFPMQEQKEITSQKEFLKHWIVKESAVKYLGGTLARDLHKLSYIKERLQYNGQDLPVFLRFFELEGHLLCVCSEQNFYNAELIRLL